MSLNQSFISDFSEFPRSLDVRMDEDMVSICKSTKCLRVSILEHLAIPGMDISRLGSVQVAVSVVPSVIVICVCVCPGVPKSVNTTSKLYIDDVELNV